MKLRILLLYTLVFAACQNNVQSVNEGEVDASPLNSNQEETLNSAVEKLHCKDARSPLGVYTGNNVEIITYDKYHKVIDPGNLKQVIASPFFERAKEQFDIRFLKVDNKIFSSGQKLRVNFIHYAIKQGGSNIEGPRLPLEKNFETPYFSSNIDLLRFPKRLIDQYKRSHCRGPYTCSSLSPNDGEGRNLPAMTSVPGFIKYKDGNLTESYCFTFMRYPSAEPDIVVRAGKQIDRNVQRRERYLREYAECLARSFGYSKYTFGPSKFEGVDGLLSLFSVRRRLPWGVVKISEEEITNTLICLNKNGGSNE